MRHPLPKLFCVSALATLLIASSAAAGSYTSVTTSSNSDIVVGDDVVINGPISRGGNYSSTIVGNNGIFTDVSTWQNPDEVVVKAKKSKKAKKKSRRKLVSRNTAGAGVGREVYRDGNCLVERKWTGGMSKETVQCD